MTAIMAVHNVRQCNRTRKGEGARQLTLAMTTIVTEKICVLRLMMQAVNCPFVW